MRLNKIERKKKRMKSKTNQRKLRKILYFVFTEEKKLYLNNFWCSRMLSAFNRNKKKKKFRARTLYNFFATWIQPIVECIWM